MSAVNILIVEDERITAEDLRLRLKELGYHVSGWAKSGEEAIVQAGKSRPDLVLMDIVLEGEMNGIEAAEKIYKEFDIPVIFLTAYSDPRTLDEAKDADAFAYLVKPLHDGELESAVPIALYKHQTEKRIRKSEEDYRVLADTLRISEEKFRGIFENSAIGIGLADSQGKLTEVNEALASIFDITDSSLFVGRSAFDCIPVQDAQKRRIQKGETVRSEFVHDFEQTAEKGCYNGRRRDSIFIDVIFTPLPTPGKKTMSGYLVQVQNISLRKQAEGDLIRERDLLHALMDSIPDMIYFKDRDSRFTRINKAEAWLLGIQRPDEAVGKTDFDFFTPDHAETAFRDEQELMSEKKPQIAKQELLKTRTVDHFWGSATKVPLRDREGNVTGMVGITRDISDLMAIQEQLEKTANALAKSNEELQHFAYIASHDLQEPLRMVASYLQLLKKRYAGRLDAEADEFIGYAVDGATRMQRLIQDMLQYSRVNTQGKPFETTDLNQTLKNVRLHLGVTIEEHSAEIVVDPLPTIIADPGQMLQLFQNLIGNALKFKGQHPPRVHVFFEEKPHETTFHIQDNGIGIEKEFYEQIFKLFRRLHSQDEYPGTGIGLAICKKIVERHGGRIWLESAPGAGSTFSFSIPKREALTA